MAEIKVLELDILESYYIYSNSHGYLSQALIQTGDKMDIKWEILSSEEKKKLEEFVARNSITIILKVWSTDKHVYVKLSRKPTASIYEWEETRYFRHAETRINTKSGNQVHVASRWKLVG